MDYRIEINNFEGPLDLLLFFIKRDKIDIYDIPISKITRDFLEYLDFLDSLNLEIGADFILFSSMLLNIKSKMLLPKQNSDDETIEDPRTDLVDKILEYKKFKHVGNILRGKLENQLVKYYSQHSFEKTEQNHNVDYSNLSLYNLMISMNRYLGNLEDEKELSFFKNKININDQKNIIIELLVKNSELSFNNLIKSKDKIFVVVVFLSLLDLIQNNRINIIQKKTNEDMVIKSA